MTKTKTPHLKEEDLVAALYSGNEQSFEKFYHRFAPVLYGSLLSWVSDSQTAENLLQDTFMKAWTNRETYDPMKGRVFTWLYNISRNVCIDYYRSRQYKKSRQAILSDDISSLINGNRPTYLRTDIIGIRKFLEKLRKEEKEVVELMYFKGFTQKEIARVMKMPLGTVKTKMSMAIKNLRSIFMNDWIQAPPETAMNN